MSYARLLRTLIITLAASVTLPLLGAGPNGVADSREAARAARAAQESAAHAGSAPTDTSSATADTPLPPGNALAVTSAMATARDTQVIRVAAAASAPGVYVGLGMAPQERPNFTADPPAFVLFVAGLLAVLFISTRRRKDR